MPVIDHSAKSFDDQRKDPCSHPNAWPRVLTAASGEPDQREQLLWNTASSDPMKSLPLAKQVLDQARQALSEGKYGHHAQVMSPGCSRGNFASEIPANRHVYNGHRPIANKKSLASNLKKAAVSLRRKRRREATILSSTPDPNHHESNGILGRQNEKPQTDPEVEKGHKRNHSGVSLPLTSSEHAELSIARDQKRRRLSSQEDVDSGTSEIGADLTKGDIYNVDHSEDTSGHPSNKQRNKRKHPELNPPRDEYDEAVEEAWAALERDDKQRKLDEQGHAASNMEHSRPVDCANGSFGVYDGSPQHEPKEEPIISPASSDLASFEKIAEQISLQTISTGGNIEPAAESSSESSVCAEKLGGISATKPVATKLKRKRKKEPSVFLDKKAKPESAHSKRRKIHAKRESRECFGATQEVGKGSVAEEPWMCASSISKPDIQYPDPDPQVKSDSKLLEADSGQPAPTTRPVAHMNISSLLDPRIHQQSSIIPNVSEQKSPTTTNGGQSCTAKPLLTSSTNNVEIPGLFLGARFPDDDGVVRDQEDTSVKCSSGDMTSSENEMQAPPVTSPETPPSSPPSNSSDNRADRRRLSDMMRRITNDYALAANDEMEEDSDSNLDDNFPLGNVDGHTGLETKLVRNDSLSVPPMNASMMYKLHFKHWKSRIQISKIGIERFTKRVRTLMASKEFEDPIASGIGHEVVAKVKVEGPETAVKHHIKFRVDEQYKKTYVRPMGSPLKRYASRLEEKRSWKALTPESMGV